jgi:hypothetical protein
MLVFWILLVLVEDASSKLVSRVAAVVACALPAANTIASPAKPLVILSPFGTAVAQHHAPAGPAATDAVAPTTTGATPAHAKAETGTEERRRSQSPSGS